MKGIDGVDHINIYSAGKTQLGRVMSNFYVEDIKTEDGIFPSVETYWHWLGIKDELKAEKDKMKTLVRGEAKKYGGMIKKEFGLKKEDRFAEKIKAAIMQKGMKHLNLFKHEYDNLPFEHYYVFYGKVVNAKGEGELIKACLNELREIAKKNR